MWSTCLLSSTHDNKAHALTFQRLSNVILDTKTESICDLEKMKCFKGYRFLYKFWAHRIKRYDKMRKSWLIFWELIHSFTSC